MLIWSGWGILVPILLAGVWFGFQEGVTKYFGDESYFLTETWPRIAAMAVAGILLFALGRRFHRVKGKVMVDKETGKEVNIKPRHTFFFLKMEAWGFLAPALAVASIYVPA